MPDCSHSTTRDFVHSPYRLGCSEMNDARYIPVRRKKTGNGPFVPEVQLNEVGHYTGNRRNPFQYVFTTIGTVVDNDHFMPFLLQFHYGMGPNETQATCYQYAHMYLI